MSDELRTLLDSYGYTIASFAREVGVSPSAVSKWLGGERPRLDTAVKVAGKFPRQCGLELLRQWDYDDAEPALDRTTHDPEVANGWRLDTLIAEQRETNRLLRKILEGPPPEPDWYTKMKESEGG